MIEKPKSLAELMQEVFRKLRVKKKSNAKNAKKMPNNISHKNSVRIADMDFFTQVFETRIDIEAGDVFEARFDFECGHELSGRHYVVAIVGSEKNNQLVTVVPLTSFKGEFNPSNNINIGHIEGTREGSESIAIINQIKAIDKCRLFERVSIANIQEIISSVAIAENDEFILREKKVLRLSDEQLKVLLIAVTDYLKLGSINR